MDWLTFKYCVLIWVLCVSKSRTQLLNSTSSISNQLQSTCQEGQPVTPPDECNSCTCFSGQVHCTNLTCPEQGCINGEEIPPPDACNSCLCLGGKVTCSKMICIPEPNCVENQLYPSQNECNACTCLNGFITCMSNGCLGENQPAVVTTTTTITPEETKRCTEGSRLPAPLECLECYCENGKKKCKYICNETVQMETRFAGHACFPHQTLPRPDECNHCVCFKGEIHCTHKPCQSYMRIGRQCMDEQMVIQFDDCNECYCIGGQLECDNLVCIRGSKCVQGQQIPKPDSCNACVCDKGHIVCTNFECPLPNSRNALIPERKATELKPLNDVCQDGDIIPSLPPPYDCNECVCIDNIIMCSMNICVGSEPEINGRLKEQNEPTYLKKFDKQISVEPFIDELYKNKDKLPNKVIHTHAYNGYQQEIKVQAKHLPKDATNLFKVLASSLDNSALASISQKLSPSSDSLSSNPNSKIPFDHNLLGEGNVLTTHSNKIITSGSQSNETILVIPNTFDHGKPESVLPLTNKHETIWKTVSAPAPIVYHNNQLIQPRNSNQENLYVYNDDRSPSFLTSVPQNDMIHRPTKFSRPGPPPALPTIPTGDILELPKVNTQYNPLLNPKPVNINDGKINYVPYYPDNNQVKPVPSGFVGKGDELPQRPLYQPTKPTFIAPNINDIQQKPSQSQYLPNLSKYYPNQVKPQEFQFKPNQNQPKQILLPASKNKGIQLPPLFPNTPNQTIVSTNQYNPPQFGLKPGQGSPLNNIDTQTDQQFNQFTANFPMNPPVINLPLPKKRISSIESDISKEIPTHSKNGTNYLQPAKTFLNLQQNGVSPEYTQHSKPKHSQFVPNPSIYYKNEFEAPKINEVKPEDEQLLPHSNYNEPHTSSKLDNKANIPKVHNKERKYNTTHSHYEKPSGDIYVPEYDLDDPDHPKIVGHDTEQDYEVPHNNENEYNVPNQDSQLLTFPNQDSSSDGKKTDQIESNQNRTNPTIPVYPNILGNYPLTFSQFIHEDSNDPGFADGSHSPANSVKDPTYQKTPSQIGTIQNQYPPGFQYAQKDPRQLKPVHKLPPSNLETPDDNNLSGMFDERGSAGGFQYPSHYTEDLSHPKQNIQKPTNSLYGPMQNQINKSSHFVPYPSNFDPTHPKDNLYIPPHPQFGPTQNQLKPGMLDNYGVKDSYQFGHNANQDPTHLKPSFEYPNFPFDPTLNQHKPGTSKGFQRPSNSDKNPISSSGFVHTPPQAILGSPQIPHLLGVFKERGSNDSFHNPSYSAENPSHAIDELNKPFQAQFGPTQNQPIGGFQYPSNSAEESIHPKDSLNNPSYPKENLNKPSPSPFGYTQNQLLPSFHYPSHFTGNSHPKQKPPYSLNGPTQNQYLPGMFDDLGSSNGYQYPSHTAEDLSHPKQNTQKPTNSLYGPTQNQHLPEMFDELGSSNGFQNPSHIAEDLSHPKQNIQKPTNSLYGSTQNQHLPGMFDELGSSKGFQYPSHTAEDPSHPKQNIQKPTNSLYGPTQNQHPPGMFDERGSTGGFQYPSHSAEDPSQSKQNIQKPTNALNGPTRNQHPPGMFDEPGSTGGFQYPSHSAEDPSHPKQNIQKPTNSLFGPTQNEHPPGMFDERGSTGGFQYPSHSAEDPSHPKQNIQKPTNALNGPTQNQHPPGMFDERGPGLQYTSHSAENPLQTKDNWHHSPQSQFLPSHKHYKENIYKQPNSQSGPIQNKHLPGLLDEGGSANGLQYPSRSAESSLPNKDNHQHPPQTQFLPSHNKYEENIHKQPNSPFVTVQYQHSAEDPTNTKDNLPNSQFGPTQNHLPGMSDERGSADGFQYPSNSAEDPDYQKNNPDTTPYSKLKQSQNQPEHMSLDDSNIPKPYSDKAENQTDKISNLYPTNNNYNPLRPWIHLDHDQYKPSSFDNHLNGIHNIPWSDPDDHKEISHIVTSTPRTRFEPDRDQYKPSSLDNLHNGVHDIPWPIPNQDNDILGTDEKITTPHAGFKPKQDQYEPSIVENRFLPISNQSNLSDEDNNELQIEQDIPTPFTELTNSRPEIKSDSDPDDPLPSDDVKVPVYYDQLYPLFKAMKKLKKPPIDDSAFSVNQLYAHPYLFPGKAKILNYEPAEDQDYALPIEDGILKIISPLSKLKTKLKPSPESGNGIFDWLQSKVNKLVPTQNNVTVNKNYINMPKIFHLLKNFTRPSVKDKVIQQNIPFIGYYPELINDIMNGFQEDILTTTPSDLTDASQNYDNRFKPYPTVTEEIQTKQIKYPDVNIILHQPFDEDPKDIPPYTQTDGAANLATDMGLEALDDPLFTKMFNPRFRHRPKDQKDECGDGTHWLSKCHSCSCYFGRPMCFKMHDCELRPFGEPMTCKPYSHFNMGCYTCECNGDGVAECDATDCTTDPSGKNKVSERTKPPLLPKDCPKQDLQAQYPTCERGSSWVSSCHKCECIESGKHECVKIDNCELNFDSYGKPGRCKPNSKFYPKTNSMACVECTCNDEGHPYCPTADYKKH